MDIQIKELEPLTSKPSLAILIVLPNTVPNSGFARQPAKMGIHNGSIVVYDTKNLFSPRAWWLLRSWDMRRFGYSMAAAWIKEGYATEKKTGTII
jgi:3-mercaptopyruvate sulfurtransferase SseA